MLREVRQLGILCAATVGVAMFASQLWRNRDRADARHAAVL